MEILSGVCVCCFVALWLRIRELEWQQHADAKYFEWWMTSMENRKSDKETKLNEFEDL